MLAHPSGHEPPWAALSCVGCLLGNCELRCRFPRGAKINNHGALLPAGMIKLLIRSSNYSALLIHPLSRAVNYLARVAVALGLAGLGAAQVGVRGVPWAALGCRPVSLCAEGRCWLWGQDPGVPHL